MVRPPLLLAVLACGAIALTPEPSANAEEFTLATLSYQPAWCAPEFDPLSSDVCHIAGSAPADGHRTLVIYLHGVIGKNTMWQWFQERAMARMAKELHFDVLVPQAPRVGPDGAGGFAWPGLHKGDAADDASLVSGWAHARRALERKNGRAYDEVYVVGFSSGAYFATSLALHGRTGVDGYVILAGGSPNAPEPDVVRTPVFVGVCARDKGSAAQARELGSLLAARGWPSRVDEQPYAHGVSDVHLAHALSWFRSRHAKAEHASDKE